MASDQADAISKLAGELSSRACVCVTGAGVGISGGLPGWRELVFELRDKFAPEVDDDPADLMAMAQSVIEVATAHGREPALRDYLHTRFEAGRVRSLHVALAALPFRGFATLNYDVVLENAVTQVRTVKGEAVPCRPIDLCAPRPRQVFEFVQELSRGNPLEGVLHLHGHCREPQRLILGHGDYEHYYGNNPDHTVLDTLHRKVIWAILTAHPVVFVGVGLRDEDPHFERMLSTVRDDFMLYAAPPHYALVGYRSEEERLQRKQALEDKGIRAIFYEIRDEDHSRLEDLLDEIRRASGSSRPVLDPPPGDISQRLMKR